MKRTIKETAREGCLPMLHMPCDERGAGALLHERGVQLACETVRDNADDAKEVGV